MSDVHDSSTDWFEVDFEDNTDGVDEESALTGAPAALLRKLRELIPTWQELGLNAGSTDAWYEEGRLCVIVNLVDYPGKMSLGSLRLEIEDGLWDAAWVTTTGAGIDNLDDADPQERTGGRFDDTSSGVDTAAEWLRREAGRPIARYVWRSQGRVAARLWRLEDSGSPMISSGPQQLVSNPESADERVQVRP